MSWVDACVRTVAKDIPSRIGMMVQIDLDENNSQAFHRGETIRALMILDGMLLLTEIKKHNEGEKQ